MWSKFDMHKFQCVLFADENFLESNFFMDLVSLPIVQLISAKMLFEFIRKAAINWQTSAYNYPMLKIDRISATMMNRDFLENGLKRKGGRFDIGPSLCLSPYSGDKSCVICNPYTLGAAVNSWMVQKVSSSSGSRLVYE